MKEIPESSVRIGNAIMPQINPPLDLTSLRAEVGPLATSPEIVGPVDAMESATILFGIGLTAFAYAQARQVGRVRSRDIDDKIAAYTVPLAFAAATVLFAVHALSTN